MFNMSNLKTALSRKVGRGTFIVRQHSPEILLAVGIVGGVTAAVMAAKATLKAKPAYVNFLKGMDDIETVHNENPQEYPSDVRDEDKAKLLLSMCVEMGKIYAPAVGVGVLSIVAILGSHGIMRRRQVQLVAAYNLLAEGFKSYRARVIEELGEEKDREFRLGTIGQGYIEEKDANGNTKLVKRGESDYARLFDETNPMWRKDHVYNMQFLRYQQNYANDILRGRGFLTLNEVYEMLGMEHSTAGFIVGWIYGKGGQDNFVDFDLDNPLNLSGNIFKRANGYMLDFNVDGVIYDKV